ncbi:MAG TPA: metal-dependent hydrolase [Gemmataceae bacterium]|jgi:inner membrane protein|nr:metal-dependent hydrolase [Gemmataceae bacterium]
MPTIYTHGVVGLGAAGAAFPRQGSWLFWILAGFLPMIPDFDAFSTAPYGTTFGHRGFTHSFVFALGVALITAGLTFKYLGMRFWILAIFFFAITASHGVLDAFTSGGYGILWLWPFSDARFGPWGPIPVADIGFDWPNPWTSRAVCFELLWIWLPTALAVGLIGVGRYVGRRFRRWRGARHK